MLLKIEEIVAWTGTNPSRRNYVEGNRVLEANHIIKILKNAEKLDGETVSIICLCLQTTHMRDSPHEVFGDFKKSGEIISMKCSCKAGLGEKCKHIIATLLYCSRYVYNLESMTSY